MLRHIEIGLAPKANTLVLTPEFLDMLKDKLKQGCSYGVRLQARLYPWVKNWLVISRANESRTPVSEFVIENEGDSIILLIPTKQCDIFDGKLVGREKDVINAPLGFLGG